VSLSLVVRRALLARTFLVELLARWADRLQVEEARQGLVGRGMRDQNEGEKAGHLFLSI
jgi:hypothetical protein